VVVVVVVAVMMLITTTTMMMMMIIGDKFRYINFVQIFVHVNVCAYELRHGIFLPVGILHR